jgi:hypothetical protein
MAGDRRRALGQGLAVAGEAGLRHLGRLGGLDRGGGEEREKAERGAGRPGDPPGRLAGAGVRAAHLV